MPLARPSSLGLALLAALICSSATLPARGATSAGVTLEVLVDGQPLAEFQARGTTYVEARRGRDYTLRLANHSGRRAAVALCVDGLNTIDARRTEAEAAAKWVLGPYETIEIPGWQTGSDTARRFVFTTERKSYGAWLNQTDNLGVIGAAVFFERAAEVRRGSAMREEGCCPGTPAERDADAERPTADSAPSRKDSAANALSDQHAATGIGGREAHPVREVQLELEDHPAGVMQVRYEYRDALVRLGVLPRPSPHEDPLDRREHAQSFAGGFCPDPYR